MSHNTSMSRNFLLFFSDSPYFKSHSSNAFSSTLWLTIWNLLEQEKLLVHLSLKCRWSGLQSLLTQGLNNGISDPESFFRSLCSPHLHHEHSSLMGTKRLPGTSRATVSWSHVRAKDFPRHLQQASSHWTY